jgi:hypothetical protein
VLSLRIVRDLAVVAMKWFRGQFVAYLVSAALTLAIVTAGTYSFGLLGAVLGLAAGEASLFLLMLLLNSKAHEQPSEPY